MIQWRFPLQAYFQQTLGIFPIMVQGHTHVTYRITKRHKGELNYSQGHLVRVLLLDIELSCNYQMWGL